MRSVILRQARRKHQRLPQARASFQGEAIHNFNLASGIRKGYSYRGRKLTSASTAYNENLGHQVSPWVRCWSARQ